MHKTSITAGIISPMLSRGVGFDIGLRSPLWQQNNFGIIAQTSFTQYKITGAFLSGKQSTGNTSALLAGPAFVFLKKSRLQPSFLILYGIQSHLVRSDELSSKLELKQGLLTEINFQLFRSTQFGFYLQSPGFTGIKFLLNIN
ncbi:MAG: hypothetical protein ACPGLV_19345 [Bacteroidia bacterium]